MTFHTLTILIYLSWQIEYIEKLEPHELADMILQPDKGWILKPAAPGWHGWSGARISGPPWSTGSCIHLLYLLSDVTNRLLRYYFLLLLHQVLVMFVMHTYIILSQSVAYDWVIILYTVVGALAVIVNYTNYAGSLCINLNKETLLFLTKWSTPNRMLKKNIKYLDNLLWLL